MKSGQVDRLKLRMYYGNITTETLSSTKRPKFNKKIRNNNCKICNFYFLYVKTIKQQKNNKNRKNIQIQKNRQNIIRLNRNKKQIQTPKLKHNTETKITTKAVKIESRLF